MSEVKAIYRYPIKGLSPQALPSVAIAAGGAFPFDRVFALIRPGAPIDPDDPQWAKKGLFLMSMLDDGLSEVVTAIDPETLTLTIERDGADAAGRRTRDPRGPGGGRGFFPRSGSGAARRAAARACARRPFHGQAGKPDLADQSGDAARTRAAMGLSDRSAALPRQSLCRRNRALARIRLDRRGAADRRPRLPGRSPQRPLRGDQCRSGDRQARPRHSRRLRAAFGHKDLGVYLRAGGGRRGGRRRGSRRPTSSRRPALRRRRPDGRGRRYMCRGCYFVYDEGRRRPAPSRLFLRPGAARTAEPTGRISAPVRPPKARATPPDPYRKPAPRSLGLSRADLPSGRVFVEASPEMAELSAVRSSRPRWRSP